jgi:hypothetical protein
VPLASGKRKVIAAGMPKSGTIAKLLAELAKVKVCSDPLYQLDVKGVVYRDRLFRGDLTAGGLWKEFKDVFRDEVIKDPNFPLFLGELVRLFPVAKSFYRAGPSGKYP